MCGRQQSSYTPYYGRQWDCSVWPTAVQLHTILRQTVRLLCVAVSSPATHQTTAGSKTDCGVDSSLATDQTAADSKTDCVAVSCVAAHQTTADSKTVMCGRQQSSYTPNYGNKEALEKEATFILQIGLSVEGDQEEVSY